MHFRRWSAIFREIYFYLDKREVLVPSPIIILSLSFSFFIGDIWSAIKLNRARQSSNAWHCDHCHVLLLYFCSVFPLHVKYFPFWCKACTIENEKMLTWLKWNCWTHEILSSSQSVINILTTFKENRKLALISVNLQIQNVLIWE